MNIQSSDIEEYIDNTSFETVSEILDELTSIYDINKETARSLAKDFNISNVYEDLNKTVNNENVVFDIAVPADKLLSIVKVSVISKFPFNLTSLLIESKPTSNTERFKTAFVGIVIDISLL